MFHVGWATSGCTGCGVAFFSVVCCGIGCGKQVELDLRGGTLKLARLIGTGSIGPARGIQPLLSCAQK